MEDTSQRPIDILYPLASLKWTECSNLPVCMHDAQAVWLKDKLYVGGGQTSKSFVPDDELCLYMYSPNKDSWNSLGTPVSRFALTTYRSQLVIVGGLICNDKHGFGVRIPTNKLWILNEHNQLDDAMIPPMIKDRLSASSAEYKDRILVAGGYSWEIRVDIVEIYDGHQWAKAQCLPKPCCRMKSAIVNGFWYLMGGEDQGKAVYYASLNALVGISQASFGWKRLKDVPHECSSPVVFQNRLMAIGGGTNSASTHSSIYSYSAYTQSWIHEGDMPIKLNCTCTVILPPGKLTIIGGQRFDGLESHVFQANLNVVFDPNNRFTMEMLSMLNEAGVIQLQEIEAHTQHLQSIIKVKHFEANKGYNSLLRLWSEGYGSLHPTWRHLFWVLRELRLNHMADQLESHFHLLATDPEQEYLKSEPLERSNTDEEEFVMDTEEQEHIASVKKAMKEKGMLDHTIVHGVFVGPARSGKNSLMERLLGQMPSIVSPSTGVAESTIQVKVIQKATTIAANVEGCLWSRMDYDDEAIRLMLINSDHHKSLEIPMVQIEQQTSIDQDGLPHDDGKDTCTSNEAESDDEWFDASSILPQDLPSVPPISPSPQVPCPRLPGSYVPPIEIVKVALRNKGKKGLEILQQHFQKTWSLYLTNTGGQMEFQEVLPLLVSGPSMFFFTFRLDRDLDERYDIEYDHPDGAKAKPYTSTLTTMDSILQTLATIAAMGTFVYQGLQKRRLPLRPKVFLVGTHKDKLDSATADKRIASIDQKLQEAIQDTSHYANLVEFATDTRLIFAVNNFSESDSDFKDIRSAVERVIVRDEFQMTSPAHWLIFSLALRKLESAVVSYDQCLEIARQCGLADTEFDQALKFIHSKMGLIRYFPYDDVKNLIVIHPQFLFDKVTELIIDTFTFEKTGKHQTDEFRHKGIFSLSKFESIRLREKTSNMISPFQFAKLLERLRIAAPFHLKGEKKYFLPCVLAHSAKEGKISKMLTSTSVPHLMITFECGYCPKGLAGALVKYLIADEAESCYTWQLRHKKIFRNQVSFKVGPHETMTLKIFSTHLEIILIPNRTFSFVRDDRIPLEKVCYEVRRVLEAGVRKVTADINYVDAQHALTFSCECKDCKGSYPGELMIIDDAPYCISCGKSEEERQFPLPKKYELWQIHKISESESSVHVVSPDLKQCSSIPITKLSENHHSALLKQLICHSSKWRDIGLHLGFQSGELEVIQAKPLLLEGAPNSWLSKMLAEWLQWAPGDGRGSSSSATLESLKAALREAGLGAKAEDLGISS